MQHHERPIGAFRPCSLKSTSAASSLALLMKIPAAASAEAARCSIANASRAMAKLDSPGKDAAAL